MLKRCCCGISLQKGTIIIGVFTGILMFISFIVWATLLSVVAVAVVRNDLIAGSNSMWVIIILVSFSLSMLFSIGQFVMALVLVRGAERQESRTIRIYLIYGTAMIVLSLISTSLSAVANATFVIPVILSFALEAYFLIVIWSYYKELVDNSGSDIVYTPGRKRNDIAPKV